jgi:hypothetical protein
VRNSRLGAEESHSERRASNRCGFAAASERLGPE